MYITFKKHAHIIDMIDEVRKRKLEKSIVYCE